MNFHGLLVDGFSSASADSVETMLIGRLLVGVGIGVNTALVPLYISEVFSVTIVVLAYTSFP